MRDDLSKQASKRIKADFKVLLATAGVSYADLAEDLGVTVSVVSDYLNKRRGLLPPIWVEIADKLGYEFALVKKPSAKL